MQARLHSPTDVWSKLWCSFWHIINTLQQKKILLVPCVLHGRSLQLRGCGICHSLEVWMWFGGRDGLSCYELWMLLVGDSAGRQLYLLGNALLDPIYLRSLQAPKLQPELP